MDLNKICWKRKPEKETYGVIVGCTEDQAWLLPWWWMNFRLFNSHPVTFVNFGDMQERTIKWCMKRGSLIHLNKENDFIVGREKVSDELAKTWENKNFSAWLLRKAWFKKPFALLESPYEITVWMDIDCQTRGSIDPLFTNYLKNATIALAPESVTQQMLNIKEGILKPDETMYNAGVIVYRHGASIIENWAIKSLTENQFHLGDQQLLNRILHQDKVVFDILPDIYNWATEDGLNRDAVILHWWGANKMHIKHLIKCFAEEYLIDLYINDK